jgi:hypothetical protein
MEQKILVVIVDLYTSLMHYVQKANALERENAQLKLQVQQLTLEKQGEG